MEIKSLATVAVDCGFKLQRLGPGLLESVYEAVLADSLARRGVAVERQKPVPILFDGISIDEGFRADLLARSAPPALCRHPPQITMKSLAASPSPVPSTANCTAAPAPFPSASNSSAPLALS